MKIVNLGDYCALQANLGKEVAVAEWKTITQDDIDRFGRSAGDDHWLHTDPVRCQASSPYGTTIGQGLLSLCYLAVFAKEILNRENECVCVNYGFNRVRFPAPVRVGKRIRAHLTISSVKKLVGGGNVTWVGTVEIEGSAKPACHAEIVSHFFFHQSP